MILSFWSHFNVFNSTHVDHQYQHYSISTNNDDLFTSFDHMQILIETNHQITKYFKEIIFFQSKRIEEARE